MMKIQILTKQTGVAQLGLLLIFGITGGYAIAQTARNESPFSLPAINNNLDIKLDNLFQENFLGQETDQLNSDNLDRASYHSMRLVGTLIMGENKLALIKTHEFQIHVLEDGERVPGSELRIDRIGTDSVELVNAVKCYKYSACKAQLVLELN